MEEVYVSKIVLELQPRLDSLFLINKEKKYIFIWKRSRRSYRRLFGIRENKFLNKESFDMNNFTKIFLNQYNKKVLQRGQHVIIYFSKFIFLFHLLLDHMW